MAATLLYALTHHHPPLVERLNNRLSNETLQDRVQRLIKTAQRLER